MIKKPSRTEYSREGLFRYSFLQYILLRRLNSLHLPFLCGQGTGDVLHSKIHLHSMIILFLCSIPGHKCSFHTCGNQAIYGMNFLWPVLLLHMDPLFLKSAFFLSNWKNGILPCFYTQRYIPTFSSLYQFDLIGCCHYGFCCYNRTFLVTGDHQRPVDQVIQFPDTSRGEWGRN